MNRFTSGLIAGGILGAVGLTALMSDKRSRRKALKSGRRAFHDAGNVMEEVKSRIW